jgi:hypothetical protein
LHIEHPPHILQPLDEGGDDDESEAGSVLTNLDGGVVTEERLLDESLGRPKRRLVPVVDLRVKKRSKVGTADDIAYDDVEAEAQAEDNTPLVQGLTIDIESGTEVAGPADQPGLLLDVEDASKTQDDDTAPTLSAEETHMDLGESAALEDPVDSETTYSPLLGPRPDDILFDLSDDGDEGADTGDGNASESEVWAELEDQEMTQAFTPAGMLGEYDLSEDEDEDGGMDEDEDVRTEEIRAAILSDSLDSGDVSAEADIQDPTPGSEEAALNGDVSMEALDGHPSGSTTANANVNEEVLDISKPTTAIASPELHGQDTNGSMVEQSPEHTAEERQTSSRPAQTIAQAPVVPAVEIVKKFTVTVANRFAAIAEATSMDDEPASIETEVGGSVPEMRE